MSTLDAGPVSTRARLLAAARAVVEDGGYGAATVAAIAERARVATGTLYRHFASKEELFCELFRAVCDHELSAMQVASAAPKATETERVLGVLVTFAERALRRPRLAWALIAEPVDPLVDAERLVYRERYTALVAGCLERAIAAGELPEQPPRLTAAALVGGCGEALVGPLARDGSDAAETVIALRGFVLRAIGAHGVEPLRATS